MKSQFSFSDIEQSAKTRVTKREKFLSDMEAIVPFKRWVSMIEPYYPKGERGRPVKGIEKMLRMYLLQIWFNLSDEMLEDCIYDSYSMKKFAGIDLLEENVPDAVTLLRFRHILEQNDLQKRIFKDLAKELAARNYLMKEGTVVDATIIQASSSTKNEDKKRDPEMSSVKKGNNWYFGCKAHIGVDKESGLIHTVKVTSANVHDSTPALKLLTGEEKEVYGDSAYLGMDKQEHAPKNIKYNIVKRKSSTEKIENGLIRTLRKESERKKCGIRAVVEHSFQVLKCKFGYRKVRYSGFAKNESHLNMLFACVNLAKLIGKIEADKPLYPQTIG